MTQGADGEKHAAASSNGQYPESIRSNLIVLDIYIYLQYIAAYTYIYSLYFNHVHRNKNIVWIFLNKFYDVDEQMNRNLLVIGIFQLKYHPIN